MQIAGERILILGDSLTHHGLDAAPPVWDVDAGSQRASSAPGDLLASLLLESGAQAVRTNAKVGRSALSFLGNEPAQQLVAADATWRPSKVIVMLGTNDTQRDLAKTEAAMVQIRDAYRAMGADVYAIGPMTYVGRGAVLNAPANSVFDAMQRVFGVDHIVDGRPFSGDFQAERSADGIHFTAHSAPILAARLLPEVKNMGSVIAAMKRRPLVSIAVGFGAVLAVGLVGLAIHRRQTVGKLGDGLLAPSKRAEIKRQIKALEQQREDLYRAMGYAGNTPEMTARYHKRLDELNAQIRALQTPGGVKGLLSGLGKRPDLKEIEHEVRDSIDRQIATTPAGKKLVACDPEAVESLAKNITGNLTMGVELMIDESFED